MENRTARSRVGINMALAKCVPILVALFASVSDPMAILAQSPSGDRPSYEVQIDQAARTIVDGVSTAKLKTIAVVDFTDLQGQVTTLGRFLAEEFSAALTNSVAGFEIVDRTHLGVLLEENKLSSTGLIDPATARKLGKIAGADGLLTGTVTDLGDT